MLYNGNMLTRNNHEPKETVFARFWSQVDYGGPGCWAWKGGAKKGGYGQFYAWDRTSGASWWAFWLLQPGDPPRGLSRRVVVQHLCHNPICVRPSHLRLGTQSENVRQAKERMGQRHRKEELEDFLIGWPEKLIC